MLLLDFNLTCTCSTDVSETAKYRTSRESIQREPSCSMRTDGQAEYLLVFVKFRKLVITLQRRQLVFQERFRTNWLRNWWPEQQSRNGRWECLSPHQIYKRCGTRQFSYRHYRGKGGPKTKLPIAIF